MAAYLKKRKG